ncbi:MAG: trypsin-like serine peptidase [Anaerolineae bacterium]
MSAVRCRKVVFTIVGVIALIALLGLVPASADVPAQSSGGEAAQPGAGLIRTSAEDGVRTAAARPWTAEEMKAAVPYPLPEMSFDGALTVDVLTGPDGPAGAVKGALPLKDQTALGALDELELLEEDAALEAAAEFLGYAYPPPFTRHAVWTIVNYQTKWPFITIGKLFFTQYGMNYVCSAAVVGSSYASRSIMTAGHCLHAGDNKSSGWSTNVVFVPAYKDGAAPYGQWSASVLAVRTPWYTSADASKDVGAAKLNKNDAGKTITQVVGYLGFAWNQSRNLHWWELGYPAASPFNGNRMITCQSSYAYDSPFGSSPRGMGVGCDMTGGCSGGPWVWRMATGNYLNGVNSHRRSGYKDELFSPYFDSAIKSLWDWAVAP